ncbi:Uncharacterized protein RNJ44_04540 [Nakaseomyces bracarensis]|uniref:Dolichyl-phosphate-mannose--protein mannosyltransferase n=1 Tax=Nakaseomyces bracarensis TaxID=273131 RepID=A0ABR4NV66_9SACH
MRKDNKSSKTRVMEKVEDSPQLELKAGPVRKYITADPTPEVLKGRNLLNSHDGMLMVLIAVVAGFARFYKLSFPRAVVYDEATVLEEVKNYFNHKFSLDVYPPLGKIVYYLFSKLSRFDVSAEFGSVGSEYLSSAVYLPQRALAAFMGTCVVIMFFMTLRISGVSRPVAGVMGCALALENSFVLSSRFVHLDSPFLFFVAAAIYFTKKTEITSVGTGRYVFTFVHAVALVGLAIATKWAGLFILAWILIVAAWRIWLMTGDLTMPVSKIIKVATFNALAIAIVPSIIYGSIFSWHVDHRYMDGQDSLKMAPAFRHGLLNSTEHSNMIRDVAVGSFVMLNNYGMDGGFVETVESSYEAGSKQRQVDLNKIPSENSQWLIDLYDHSGQSPAEYTRLKGGDKVKFWSPNFKCRLHSHDHPAPVSSHVDWQKEISCYGFLGFAGDGNDDWIIEIDKERSEEGEAQEYVHAVDTKFRLRHAMTGCYMFSHKVNLRTEGFRDTYEVDCAHQGKYELTLWTFDQVLGHPHSPENVNITNYKPVSKIEKLKTLHSAMIETSKAETDKGVFKTFPKPWPLMDKGIPFWNGFSRQIYFLGNGVMWWSVTAFIVLFVLLLGLQLVFWQMGGALSTNSHYLNFHIQVIEFGAGYALSFIPYVLTTDRHYLYQFLPAYYFGLLIVGHVFEVIYGFLFKNKRTGLAFVTFFLVASAAFFQRYSVLTYASEWTAPECKSAKLFGGWKFDCQIYPDSYAAYNTISLDNYNETNAKDLDQIGVGNDLVVMQPRPLHTVGQEKKVKHKYVDANGNELDPQEAERLLAEEKLKIQKVIKN